MSLLKAGCSLCIEVCIFGGKRSTIFGLAGIAGDEEGSLPEGPAGVVSELPVLTSLGSLTNSYSLRLLILLLFQRRDIHFRLRQGEPSLGHNPHRRRFAKGGLRLGSAIVCA